MTRIIADLCLNHMGSIPIAEAMVKAAAASGVDVCKFQSYHADKLNPSWPDYEEAKANYARLQFTAEQFAHLKSYCEGKGVEFLCTAFDVDAADMIAKLGCDTVKVASPSSGDWLLLERCLDRFKTLIVSVGMSTPQEFDSLVRFIQIGNMHERIVMMHCVSIYPLPLDKVNMQRMCQIRDMGIPYGWSDHSLTLEPAKLAIALGAHYVERHLTMHRGLPGKDQAIATTPEEFAELARWRNQIEIMMKSNSDEPHNRQYVTRWNA